MVKGVDSREQLNKDAIVIKNKKFLKLIYEDFYKYLTPKDVPTGLIIELGSGAGFIKEIIPNTITSDIVEGKGVDKVFSAEKIPFKENSVSAFLMIDVLHHIKDPEKALREMQRCLKVGGKIIMIEPYNTYWGRFIYKHIHREHFDPNSSWLVSGQGRMSDSNTALPWIIFTRDKKTFENKFPRLKILRIQPFMPFTYLFSGGLSKYQFLPTFAYPLIKIVEKMISPINHLVGMFAIIELKKN